ncbi:hypothetical protein BGZ96_010708 [Linnemannia gamsii]|uniref:Uncharacterized protein n=1 Tax=Linnemannia gamsii TaxID=64522 RepID=A0ABQ7JU58_9FUNG|nr:hypothetical protein BGZ96_010708 [Linnemannia gamsii]
MLFKFSSATLLIVMAAVMMVTRTSAYELWYRRCGGNKIIKTYIEGDACLALDDIDRHFCEHVPHGSTGCKRYKDEHCEYKGIKRHGYIYCTEP